MQAWEKIIKLNSIESTNIYFAQALNNTEFAEGSIISTQFQLKGKGYADNAWESENGKNILMSLVLYPKFLAPENNFLISKCVSLGIVDYLNAKTNSIKIKWPNDIYFKDKKLAGILIENVIKGSTINQSIVGIGLNINQKEFKSDAPNPISLSQITQKTYLIDQEIVKLRNNIHFYYEKLRQQKFDDINTAYLKCLYRFNEYHNFKINQNVIKAKITGVADYGYLQITTETNEKKEFDFKEIEFII